MLTIEHTHAGGTLLHGTSRGDGSAEVLRTRPGGSYWKWSRNLSAWYMPHSRDHLAKRHTIDATADALRAAGFDVETSVDDTPRDVAQVLEDRRERSSDRAEALHAKAERRLAESDARYDAAGEIAHRRPFGQPILVGHHSEAGARADQRRIERHMDAFVELRAESAEATRKAQAAEHNATRRESRFTVSNRVAKLAADVAKDLRTLHGRHGHWSHVTPWHEPIDPDSAYGVELTRRIAHNTYQRHYWADVLADMPAAIDATTVRKGDTVKVHGRWHEVVRVNGKSCSVATGYSWTDRVPWARITGHRPAVSEPAPVELDA